VADVTERTLRLLALLQTGRAFTGEELARRLEVSARTLRRDVERLRGYGYPVRTRPGPGGHYQLTAGSRLPPLVLDDDEAVATAAALAALAALATTSGGRPDGLGEAAARAFGKIDAVLPARLRPRVAAVRAGVESEPRAAPPVAARVLGDLAEAIAARDVVTFGYADARGETSERRVEPHRLVHLDPRWYLVGWDRSREDWRVFRADRVTALVRTGERHQPRALPADTAIGYLRSGLGRAGVEPRAETRLDRDSDV